MKMITEYTHRDRASQRAEVLAKLYKSENFSYSVYPDKGDNVKVDVYLHDVD